MTDRTARLDKREASIQVGKCDPSDNADQFGQTQRIAAGFVDACTRDTQFCR